MSRDFSQSCPYKLGDLGQKLVVEKLKECGWHVVPSYDFNGKESKAPALQGAEGVLVLPDIDASRRGQRRWVEVKTKTDRARFALWDHREVHGIALNHYHQYFKVQQQTGAEVWLFIYERKANNILCAPLLRLASPAFHRIYAGKNEVDRGGSIYFDIRAFDLFGIPGQYGEFWELKDGRWLLEREGGASA